MSYTTLEVEFDHGRVVPKEPDKLPESGHGLLTILPPEHSDAPKPERKRVQLPIIHCKPGSKPINPTPEELDASLWD
jgi:hypothetical protein